MVQPAVTGVMIMYVFPITNSSICLNNQNCNPSFNSRFANGMKRPRHIKNFVAMQQLNRYNPLKMNFGNYTIPVHNEGIGQKLKRSYSASEFDTLYNFAKSKGTFDYVMNNKTGFIKTSFINRKENPLMSDLIWITDSCNNMLLAKRQKPEDCTKILDKLTDFYEAQKPNFDAVIANPEKYKENTFWPGKGQVGVGHCFVPETRKPHHWFALTRLESVGNYLQTASDMITSGFSGKPYGYKSASEVPDKVIDAIANCTKYLYAINYPKARSCGAWEEQTFVNSLTSDTSIINQGMRDIINLMFSPTSDKNLLEVRTRLLDSKHGDIFNEKEALTDLLRKGEARVKARPGVETFKDGFNKKVEQKEEICLERDYDSAMSFIHQTEILDSDVLKDSEKKMDLLSKLEKAVVRPNGAIRYKGDEYLSVNFPTIKTPWQKHTVIHEAEWFLVSEISSAYGAIVKNLLNYAEKQGLTPEASELLRKALSAETEYINRSYARITPKNMTKSNGYSCPAYKVPEAYEAVNTSKGLKFVPGAHTLTWAESSLMKASDIYSENLVRIEKMGLNV